MQENWFSDPPLLDLNLSQSSGEESEDISFDNPTAVPGLNKVSMMCGWTYEVENSRYQQDTTEVCAYWTEVGYILIFTSEKLILL